MYVDEIATPALLVDRMKLLQNIGLMAEKARQNNVELRPHIKTHKCLEIGRLQRGEGAKGITVSTPGEAHAFIDGGFSDITLAFPPTPDKIPVLLDIAEQASLKIIVDNASVVAELDSRCSEAKTELDVLLKVDCGYHRCGVNPTKRVALSLARKISKAQHLHFRGILTHAGHAYDATTVEEIAKVAKEEQETMIKFADLLLENSLTPEVVSIGSTPTCMIAEGFMKGITEIRPGNYVFFDATQVALGLCRLADCALTVLASVVSVQKNHVVIDAGATAFSQDTGATHIIPEKTFGVVLADQSTSSPAKGVQIVSLSQEHGKIRFSGKSDLEPFKLGDRLRIIPNHSCLTANLFSQYFVVEGGQAKTVWPIQRHRFSNKMNNSQ